MATSSYLNADDIKRGLQIEKGPALSKWLGDRLLARLQTLPGWVSSEPIALGSWARGELCPNSDIDLLFVGPEAEVERFMRAAQAEAIKVRGRVPQNPGDWTAGVELFDVLALLKAKPFSARAQELLEKQQRQIQRHLQKIKNATVTQIKAERLARARRYDSITHFLEPNLKYGPGGLRDLEQTFVLFDLYANKLQPQSVAKILAESRDFLLSVRQWLHLLGGSEVLTAPEQIEIAGRMGFREARFFSRDLHLTLDHVGFLAEWTLQQVKMSAAKAKSYEKSPTSVNEMIASLQQDSSVSEQGRIRSSLGKVEQLTHPSGEQAGRWILKSLQLGLPEGYFQALFRSKLLQHLVPDLDRVTGFVQHDHYHRYSLDTHIQQCLVNLNRFYQRPKLLGPLQFLIKDFEPDDWKIMALTALYHDLGKGLGGDHSGKGVDIVARDFKKYGWSESLVEDVSWMVENHLILSTAAFRRNPQDPATWRWLLERGVSGEKLRRLALWTVIDINSTNPEAWTSWKAKLLENLVHALESKGAHRLTQLLDLVKEKKLKINVQIFESLDLAALEGLAPKVLLKDLGDLERQKGDLPLLIHRVSKQRYWVRFHRRLNERGLFLEFVNSLYAVGGSILHSSILTLPEVGVYDWFLIRSSKTKADLKKALLRASLRPRGPVQEHKFAQISVIGQSDNEWVLSFRGEDRRGMLLSAARALFEEEFEILWAKVHTWGKQVDDVFGVLARGEMEEAFRRLKARWQDQSERSLSI